MPWLVKTEPTTYSYDDLARDKRTVWDGVKNPQALRGLAEMKAGDVVVVYHTGAEKAAVGLARVARAAYPVVELEAVARLAQPVPLAVLKEAKEFAGSPLLRQGRLSVVPLTAAQLQRIERAR